MIILYLNLSSPLDKGTIRERREMLLLLAPLFRLSTNDCELTRSVDERARIVLHFH
jgi:hypothetical protein